ncbi:MAG: phosphatase PAP2 family protein [Dehalococcoidia bacterium]
MPPLPDGMISLFHRPWRVLTALGLTLVAGMAAGLLSIWAFSWIANGVLERETEALDLAVLSALAVHKSPALDALAWWASAAGNELVFVLLVGLVAWLVLRGRRLLAVELLVVTVGAHLLNSVLKDLFARTRPAPVLAIVPAQAFSFPSGHAMVSAAFYFFVGWLVWSRVHGRVRLVVAAVTLVVIAGIGLSRLYLGVHYLTDVIAGLFAGFLWADAVIVADALAGRRLRGRAYSRRGGSLV